MAIPIRSLTSLRRITVQPRSAATPLPMESSFQEEQEPEAQPETRATPKSPETKVTGTPGSKEWLASLLKPGFTPESPSPRGVGTIADDVRMAREFATRGGLSFVGSLAAGVGKQPGVLTPEGREALSDFIVGIQVATPGEGGGLAYARQVEDYKAAQERAGKPVDMANVVTDEETGKMFEVSDPRHPIEVKYIKGETTEDTGLVTDPETGKIYDVSDKRHPTQVFVNAEGQPTLRGEELTAAQYKDVVGKLRKFGVEEYERVEAQLAEFGKKNIRLADGKWLDRGEVEKIKTQSPKLYNTLVTKGLDAFNKEIARHNEALALLKDDRFQVPYSTKAEYPEGGAPFELYEGKEPGYNPIAIIQAGGRYEDAGRLVFGDDAVDRYKAAMKAVASYINRDGSIDLDKAIKKEPEAVRVLAGDRIVDQYNSKPKDVISWWYNGELITDEDRQKIIADYKAQPKDYTKLMPNPENRMTRADIFTPEWGMALPGKWGNSVQDWVDSLSDDNKDLLKRLVVGTRDPYENSPLLFLPGVDRKAVESGKVKASDAISPVIGGYIKSVEDSQGAVKDWVDRQHPSTKLFAGAGRFVWDIVTSLGAIIPLQIVSANIKAGKGDLAEAASDITQLGGGMIVFPFAVAGEMKRDPISGTGYAIGAILGPKAVVSIVGKAYAYAHPKGIPSGLTMVELSTGRIGAPWYAPKGAIGKAVGDALKASMETGEGIGTVEYKGVKIQYRRTPIQQEVGGVLWHGTNEQGFLSKPEMAVEKAGMYFNPYAAQAYMAGGRSPAMAMLLTSPDRVKAVPFEQAAKATQSDIYIRKAGQGLHEPSKIWRGDWETEIVAAPGTKFNVRQARADLLNRLLMGNEAEYFTQYTGPTVKGLAHGQLVPVRVLVDKGVFREPPTARELYQAKLRAAESTLINVVEALKHPGRTLTDIVSSGYGGGAHGKAGFPGVREMEVIDLPNRNRATIIVRNNKGEILLTRMKGTNRYDLPGGGVEEMESPLRSAKREFREETGVNAHGVRYAGKLVGKFEKTDQFQDNFIIYEGKIKGKPRPKAEIAEHIWWDGKSKLTYPVADFVKRFLAGERGAVEFKAFTKPRADKPPKTGREALDATYRDIGEAMLRSKFGEYLERANVAYRGMDQAAIETVYLNSLSDAMRGVVETRPEVKEALRREEQERKARKEVMPSPRLSAGVSARVAGRSPGIRASISERLQSGMSPRITERLQEPGRSTRLAARVETRLAPRAAALSRPLEVKPVERTSLQRGMPERPVEPVPMERVTPRRPGEPGRPGTPTTPGRPGTPAEPTIPVRPGKSPSHDITTIKRGKLRGALDTEARRQAFAGSFGWQQGIVIWAAKAPYKSKDDFASFSIKNPPPGFKMVDGGPEAAFRSIQQITGKEVPRDLKLDLGIVDIKADRPGKPGAAGAIGFTADPEQKTKGDVTLGEHKPRVITSKTVPIRITRGNGNGRMRQGRQAPRWQPPFTGLRSKKEGKIYRTRVDGGELLSRRPLGRRRRSQ